MGWGLLFIFLNIQTQASVCDFYLEKSAELGCKEENYLTEFGYKYCEKFERKAEKLKPETQVILKNIRECLVRTLANEPNLTCDSVEAIAFESHYDCYVQNNFCDISIGNRFHIYFYLRQEIGNDKIRKFRKEIKQYCKTSD